MSESKIGRGYGSQEVMPHPLIMPHPRVSIGAARWRLRLFVGFGPRGRTMPLCPVCRCPYWLRRSSAPSTGAESPARASAQTQACCG